MSENSRSTTAFPIYAPLLTAAALSMPSAPTNFEYYPNAPSQPEYRLSVTTTANTNQTNMLGVLGDQKYSASTTDASVPSSLNAPAYQQEEDLSPEILMEAVKVIQESISRNADDVNLERFEERFEEKLSTFLTETGIQGLNAQYLKLREFGNRQALWCFARVLGNMVAPSTFVRRRNILTELLDSNSPGIRSAAASALGYVKDSVSINAIQRRLAKETNRLVIATLKAHIPTIV